MHVFRRPAVRRIIWTQTGAGAVAFVTGFVDILFVRYIVNLDDMVVFASAAQMGLYALSMVFFKDWKQYKMLLPVTSVMHLVGIYLALRISL